MTTTTQTDPTAIPAADPTQRLRVAVLAGSVRGQRQSRTLAEWAAGLKRAIDWHYGEWAFKAATVLSYGVQGGLLATEHLRGVFAELHVVTTRRVVGLRAPWHDVSAGRYLPPPGVDEAFDAALSELGWWAQTLRTARRERPFQR